MKGHAVRIGEKDHLQGLVAPLARSRRPTPTHAKEDDKQIDHPNAGDKAGKRQDDPRVAGPGEPRPGRRVRSKPEKVHCGRDRVRNQREHDANDEAEGVDGDPEILVELFSSGQAPLFVLANNPVAVSIDEAPRRVEGNYRGVDDHRNPHRDHRGALVRGRDGNVG